MVEMFDRIQYEEFGLWFAVTRISVRCLTYSCQPATLVASESQDHTPNVRTVAWYGLMGTKSLAMTVIEWLSMEKCCRPEDPPLTTRNRWVFPGVNRNSERPALLVQGVPSVTREQSKNILPFMRLLSE